MKSSYDVIESLRVFESADASYLDMDSSLVFAKGKGVEVFDLEGRRYLDFCSGFGVLALGHNHPVHREIFAQQLNECPPVVHGMGDVYPSVDKAILIKRLVSSLPAHLTRCSLALSGGQAVELAIKTALLRKPGIVVNFSGSYHGLDLGILGTTSRSDFKDPFRSWLPQNFLYELPYKASRDTLLSLRDTCRQRGLPLSAIIVEPIQGRGGVIPGGISWLNHVAEVCHELDGLLILDEIFTGLGRTGHLTFSGQIPCDLICLGKALAGGMPLSACVGREDVMRVWPENQGEALHTGTFFGHPLSCRFAERTLNYICTEGLCESARAKGEWLMAALRDALAPYSKVKEIRGQGLMIGVEFQETGMGVRLMKSLRDVGLIVLPSGPEGNVLSLTPPLVIEDADLQQGVELIRSQVAAAHR